MINDCTNNEYKSFVDHVISNENFLLQWCFKSNTDLLKSIFLDICSFFTDPKRLIACDNLKLLELFTCDEKLPFQKHKLLVEKNELT